MGVGVKSEKTSKNNPEKRGELKKDCYKIRHLH